MEDARLGLKPSEKELQKNKNKCSTQVDLQPFFAACPSGKQNLTHSPYSPVFRTVGESHQREPTQEGGEHANSIHCPVQSFHIYSSLFISCLLYPSLSVYPPLLLLQFSLLQSKYHEL